MYKNAHFSFCPIINNFYFVFCGLFRLFKKPNWLLLRFCSFGKHKLQTLLKFSLFLGLSRFWVEYTFSLSLFLFYVTAKRCIKWRCNLTIFSNTQSIITIRYIVVGLQRRSPQYFPSNFLFSTMSSKNEVCERKELGAELRLPHSNKVVKNRFFKVGKSKNAKIFSWT